LALLTGAMMVTGAPAVAADYLAGKTITVQVPSGSRGSCHAHCQMVQRNLSRFIAGKPNTVIQKLPGGGGAKTVSYMYNVIPKNGPVTGNITTPLVRKVKFDATKFEWLGSPAARSSALWFWHTAEVKSLEDVKKREIPIATSGFGSISSVLPGLGNKYLGTKLNTIYGYRGGGLINLSIEKGEVMGCVTFHSAFSAGRPTWLPEKKVSAFLLMGPRDPHPAFKGVPHIMDLLKEGSVERAVYYLIAINLEVGQAFYVAPGMSKRIVDELGTAFAAMLADPTFKKQVIKRGLEYFPVSAADIWKKIELVFSKATPAILNEVKKTLHKTKKGADLSVNGFV
jgi:tripartite-type tricarboxylate transporter receptor subunit TctC